MVQRIPCKFGAWIGPKEHTSGERKITLAMEGTGFSSNVRLFLSIVVCCQIGDPCPPTSRTTLKLTELKSELDWPTFRTTFYFKTRTDACFCDTHNISRSALHTPEMIFLQTMYAGVRLQLCPFWKFVMIRGFGMPQIFSGSLENYFHAKDPAL